jgi:photosystem II stability/assembly factor-like uncharacterized protein
MRLHGLICVSLVLSLHSGACDFRLNAPAPEAASPVKNHDVVPRHVQAVIGSGTARLTGFGERRVEGAAHLHSAQFLNPDTGWLAGWDSLYKTSDAGSTWERLHVEVPPRSRIASFIFVDGAKGWLARVHSEDVDAERFWLGNSSDLMTTDDGGRTWEVQASFKGEAIIWRVNFLNASEGFVVGSTVRDGRPPYGEPFVARTVDGGRTWSDLSERVNSAIEKSGAVVSDEVTDVHLSSASRVVLLTGLGKVISSDDGGDSWKVATSIRRAPLQPYFRKISLGDSGNVRIVAMETGDEGYRGHLIVGEGDDSWVSYDLGATPIFDAAFPSDREVVACGGTVTSLYSESPLAGSILYSPDAGKSWSVAYKSASEHTFVSVSRVDGNQFYAVGEAGTFLKFTLTN